ASRVNGRRDEAMPERVHLDQRRQAYRAAKVVGISSLGQGGAGFGLDRDDARRAALAQLLTDEWKRQPGEVGATTNAADHDVRVFPGAVHLLQSFLADHRLM